MVEWCLAISRPADVDELDSRLKLEANCTGRLGELQTGARQALQDSFGAVRFSRIYFGSEFCERLAPRASEVRRAYQAAAARGLDFTLLASYVTNCGLQRFRPLFAHLASLGDPDVEVVINDWGLLRLLRREFPRLRPVLGRLMNRMLRDPRIVRYLAAGPAPEGVPRALRQSALTSPVYRRLLRRLGIERVEFDNVPQGLDMDFRQLGIEASLYLPYGYVATGRVCLMGSLQLPKAKKFDVASPCCKECRQYTLRFAYTNSPFDGGEQELFERGNTFFYFQDRPMMTVAAEMVERLGIGRIVYQAALPV